MARLNRQLARLLNVKVARRTIVPRVPITERDEVHTVQVIHRCGRRIVERRKLICRSE
jgi:hypothetical protein